MGVLQGRLITFNDQRAAMEAAARGVGIAFWAEDQMQPYVGREELVPLLEDWDSILNVNLHGTFLHSREAMKVMIETKQGDIVTGILDDIMPNGREFLSEHGEESPIGRAAQPEEIAEVIAFAACDRASYMTGSVIMADGGYTAV